MDSVPSHSFKLSYSLNSIEFLLFVYLITDYRIRQQLFETFLSVSIRYRTIRTLLSYYSTSETRSCQLVSDIVKMVRLMGFEPILVVLETTALYR